MLGVETNLYFAENDLKHGASFKGITKLLPKNSFD
jgi:hypothetical protein